MNDRAVGGLIFGGSLGFGAVYVWLLVLSPWGYMGLIATALLAVLGVLGILAWIGYTMATTPPPKPIEDFEKELEPQKAEATEEGKAAGEQA